MPAFRNIRRSRRISNQPPRDPNTDEYDLYDLHLMFPDSDPESSPSPTATTPPDLAPYSPADDVGEPEVDLDSPPLPPTSIRTFPAQRSSHSRKRDPDYVPRPPNAFMLFRSELWNTEKIKETVERDHRQISRIAGQLWNQLTPTQRAPYQAKAEEAKRLHAIAHPNYKYTPVYRKDRGMKRKGKPDHSGKVHRCQQVARLMQRGFLGDDLEKELGKRAAARADDCSSDEFDEYVEGPRRKKARKSSARKVVAPPRSRRPRLAKAQVKYEDYDQVLVPSPAVPNSASVKYETPAAAAEPHIKQQYISPVLHLALPPPSSEAECGEFVATDDIPECSLGEPAYNCEVQFTDPFSSDFLSCCPETPFSSHDPLSPAPECLSLSGDFLDFPTDASSQKFSSTDDAFIGGIFDIQPGPLINPYETYGSDYDFESVSTFYPYSSSPDQLSADPEFSDWMRYDNCAETSY